MMKRGIQILFTACVLSLVPAANASAQVAGGMSDSKHSNTRVIREETEVERLNPVQIHTGASSWDDKVYDVVEQMPKFPGGQSELFSWLARNIQYPPVAEENGIQGRVVVSCVIDHDGSVTEVKVVKSVDPSLDKEALRVVKRMPKWEPGRQNGKTVRVRYSMPVTFHLQ